MKKIKLIILLIAALMAIFLGVWVVQDNALETGVTLLGFGLGELPVGLWILGFFLAGVVAGAGLCYPTIFVLKRQSRRNMKRLHKLDAELKQIRAELAPEQAGRPS